MSSIVVVGASVAGIRACETLRAEGFAGTIHLINPEPGAPYDRPPLSKQLLKGDWDAERVALRKPEQLDSLTLTVHEGVTATSLDVAGKAVTLSNGETLSFEGMIIATGAAARRLPNQPTIAGVHELRTLNDAMAIRDRLTEGTRMVVIGAGFIGLEAAATAHQRGVKVTVLEGLPVPLARAMGSSMGHAIASVHTRNGVEVRCNVKVEAILGDTHVTGVQTDGGVIDADIVLVGIGVAPNTAWLESSGIELRDGVVCDATLRAAPHVYAAGDVARWPNALFADIEPDMRVEHWTNAAEHGAIAAKNLLAELNGTERTAYTAAPFFWSDQFDARIQFVGRAYGDADVDVVAGNPDEGRFCALYSKNGTVCGILGVTMPKLVMSQRGLVERRAPRDEALAAYAALTSGQ